MKKPSPVFVNRGELNFPEIPPKLPFTNKSVTAKQLLALNITCLYFTSKPKAYLIICLNKPPFFYPKTPKQPLYSFGKKYSTATNNCGTTLPDLYAHPQRYFSLTIKSRSEERRV